MARISAHSGVESLAQTVLLAAKYVKQKAIGSAQKVLERKLCIRMYGA